MSTWVPMRMASVRLRHIWKRPLRAYVTADRRSTTFFDYAGTRILEQSLALTCWSPGRLSKAHCRSKRLFSFRFRDADEARSAVRILKNRGVDFIKIQDAIPQTFMWLSRP